MSGIADPGLSSFEATTRHPLFVAYLRPGRPDRCQVNATHYERSLEEGVELGRDCMRPEGHTGRHAGYEWTDYAADRLRITVWTDEQSWPESLNP